MGLNEARSCVPLQVQGLGARTVDAVLETGLTTDSLLPLVLIVSFLLYAMWSVRCHQCVFLSE